VAALLLATSMVVAPGLAEGQPPGSGEVASAASAATVASGGGVPDGLPPELGRTPVRVTLVSGDRVTLTRVEGRLATRVDPGPGRDDVRFSTQQGAGHLYVVPSDAVGLLAAGRLDRRQTDAAGRSQQAGDLIEAEVALSGDGAGHPGRSGFASARTTLLRNGEVVGETDSPGFGRFAVPPEAADHRLEVDITRPVDAQLSTRTTAAWSFRSAHVDGDEPAPLPLLAVRFAPPLDDHNRARAGTTLEVPVTVDRVGDVGRVAQPPSRRRSTRVSLGRPSLSGGWRPAASSPSSGTRAGPASSRSGRAPTTTAATPSSRRRSGPTRWRPGGDPGRLVHLGSA